MTCWYALLEVKDAFTSSTDVMLHGNTEHGKSYWERESPGDYDKPRLNLFCFLLEP